MREVLKSVFDNEYQGYPVFIDNVLRPIFGADIEVLPVKEELGLDKETLRRASIKELYRVATIDRMGTDTIEVFDVTLDDKTIISRSRVGIQRIIRSAIFQYTHAFMLFHYENPRGRNWRFSYAYKQDKNSSTTEAKRYTYLFGPDLHCRTAIDRFSTLAKSPKDNKALLDAFSVEALSDEFFDTYRKQYAKFVKYITGKEFVKEGKKWVEKQTGIANDVIFNAFSCDDKRVRDYVKKMMGRITFLHFLQRKRWLNGDLNFMLHLFQKSDKQDNYLEAVLEPLFFGILNTKEEDRAELFADKGWDEVLLDKWKSIPYLNGGLFEADEEDKVTVTFPRDYFAELFAFYSEYNFTVDENDPDDAEVGVDPEMLGKIFENLLEDNKDKGAFYTPKEIVRYMCQESLVAYLVGKSEIDEHRIRDFVMFPYDNVDKFKENELENLLGYLGNVKICDPAIGSGAFPMGLLNELVHCEEAIVLGQEKNTARAELKKSIIKNNIYGVDIEKGAVDIARLRFWLSLVVDEDKPLPLPNLDYKIMQGNSLLESYNGVDLSHLIESLDNDDLFAGAAVPIQMQLEQKINEYYSCVDHRRKLELKDEIKKLITQQFEAKGIKIDLSGIDVTGNTHFFLWHTWFSDVFERSGNNGFDIVIGNPPYIQLQSSSGELAKLYANCGYNTFIRTGDIYCLFYERGQQLLKSGGYLCYITSNKWMRSAYGEKTREFLSDNTNPLLLVDFSGIQIFESATVDTNILLFSKSLNQHKTRCAVPNKQNKDSVKNLSVFVQHHGVYCEFSTSDSWVILTPIEQSIKCKIESIGTPLKDWNIQINYGIKTGFNDAFIINTEKRNEILRNCQSTDERNRTAELIRPILRGRDIKRYGYDWANLWLINTHNGIKGKLPRIDINDYPAVKGYLDQYWDKMKDRTDQGDTPYNLRNCAYLEDFFKPKITWGNLNLKATYSFVQEDIFINAPSPFIATSNIAILHILNSKLADYYIRLLGVTRNGGYFEYKPMFVENIPIPLTGLDPLKRYSINPTEEQEKEINNVVYELYHLSLQEINYIENREI